MFFHQYWNGLSNISPSFFFIFFHSYSFSSSLLIPFSLISTMSLLVRFSKLAVSGITSQKRRYQGGLTRRERRLFEEEEKEKEKEEALLEKENVEKEELKYTCELCGCGEKRSFKQKLEHCNDVHPHLLMCATKDCLRIFSHREKPYATHDSTHQRPFVPAMVLYKRYVG